LAKRYREFRRINLTAKVAQFIRESLVDKTFNDHYTKKRCVVDPTGLTLCPHEQSRSLHVARLVESQITVGKKRGRLDVPCPYSTNNPDDMIRLLETLVYRLRDFSKKLKVARTRGAVLDVCKQIDDYAHRNAMEVLAETVIDVDR
jgi:hypothetical protein